MTKQNKRVLRQSENVSNREKYVNTMEDDSRSQKDYLQ